MKIFITGISSGIGRELAKTLVSSGHEVWGIARRKELLESLSLEINSDLYHWDKCNTIDFAQVQNLYHKMQSMNFIPEVIFLNAAIDREDQYPKVSGKLGSEILRTNIEGSLNFLSLFIEPFLKRGSGQFIAVSSLYANWPDKSSVSYSASKAGLSMLIRGMRIRYPKNNIQFKIVYLGPVDTGINPRFKDNQANINSPIVASKSATASFLAKCIFKRKLNYYYPLYIHLIFVLLRWLPDRIFEFLTAKFKR